MAFQPKKSTLKRAKKNLPVPHPAVNDWSTGLRKPVKTGNLWIEATATDAIFENCVALVEPLIFYSVFDFSFDKRFT
jgi:hypothetical protein